MDIYKQKNNESTASLLNLVSSPRPPNGNKTGCNVRIT